MIKNQGVWVPRLNSGGQQKQQQYNYYVEKQKPQYEDNASATSFSFHFGHFVCMKIMDHLQRYEDVRPVFLKQ